MNDNTFKLYSVGITHCWYVGMRYSPEDDEYIAIKLKLDIEEYRAKLCEFGGLYDLSGEVIFYNKQCAEKALEWVDGFYIMNQLQGNSYAQ